MNSLLTAATSIVYQSCLKPIFFLFDPETIHDSNVSFGKALAKSKIAQRSLSWMWSYQDISLSKVVDGIHFPNPVGLSAGFDYDGDLCGILPSVGFGFHTIGTITLEPYEGNVPPRLGRLPRSRALIVNKGLKNIGARAVITKLENQRLSIPTGISIASTNKLFATEDEQINDMIQCFRLFESSTLRHAYYELNISCPNTFGGEPFTTPDKLERLMTQMDTLTLSRPLYVKMPIDQSEDETRALLGTLSHHKVQGVIFGNLTKDKNNPAVDIEDRKIWASRKGNLSGKPTWARSNNLIKLTREHYQDRFTIIGTGGIFSGEDAAAKMKAGADLVQLITGMIYEGPQLIGKINHYLAMR